MTSGSEVMCRKKVDTPWSIYRDFTVMMNYLFKKTIKILFPIFLKYPDLNQDKLFILIKINNLVV